MRDFLLFYSVFFLFAEKIAAHSRHFRHSFAHHFHHLFSLWALHHFHHLAHLLELFHQSIYILNFSAGTSGDTVFSLGVDD